MRPQMDALDDAEQRAISQMKPELYEHAKLIRDAFNLVDVMTGHFTEQTFVSMSQALKVALLLLARLSTDLRSLTILASRGYAMQAASLAACVYETAYAIAFIGSDEQLAQKWIDHDDPTRPVHNVRDMTRRALEKLGTSDLDASTREHYGAYRQLCMAKHINPLLQREHSFCLQDHYAVGVHGPNTSEPAIRATWFALEHAAKYAFMAILSFLSNHTAHLSDSVRADLTYRLHDLGDRRLALEKKAIERWGTEDPFPGKWRV